MTLALVPLVYAAVLWVPTTMQHLQLIYWQSRCVNYVPAPGQAVDLYLRSGRADVPVAWSRFYSMLSPPGHNSRGTVYLGWLQRPDGARRLVAIDTCTWSISGQRDTVGLICRVIVPGNLIRSPRFASDEISATTSGQFVWRIFMVDLRPESQVLFGLRDPGDPTHLTIQYTHEGKQYFIDGWLRNNDRVLLEQRSEQAPIWPAPSSRPSA
ncbi:hypothetical protein [Fontivita pretiosa]|uniref:hypothetical protein n=1 Tax=Fontivita pretiosa TaxID=2989684 RepID=UPI003D168AD1